MPLLVHHRERKRESEWVRECGGERQRERERETRNMESWARMPLFM
jgi:hypothetical protein